MIRPSNSGPLVYMPLAQWMMNHASANKRIAQPVKIAKDNGNFKSADKRYSDVSERIEWAGTGRQRYAMIERMTRSSVALIRWRQHGGSGAAVLLCW